MIINTKRSIRYVQRLTNVDYQYLRIRFVRKVSRIRYFETLRKSDGLRVHFAHSLSLRSFREYTPAPDHRSYRWLSIMNSRWERSYQHIYAMSIHTYAQLSHLNQRLVAYIKWRVKYRDIYLTQRSTVYYDPSQIDPSYLNVITPKIKHWRE